MKGKKQVNNFIHVYVRAHIKTKAICYIPFVLTENGKIFSGQQKIEKVGINTPMLSSKLSQKDYPRKLIPLLPTYRVFSDRLMKNTSDNF